MAGPKWRTYDEAVAWAQTQDLDDRRIISRTEGFIASGWASPDATEQNALRELAVAAVAEARTRGRRAPRERTGRASFS
jgi:hypothetical protein